MTVKFNQCNTDVTRVQYILNMPTSQIKCYNVTVLQPIHWLKTRKNILTTVSYFVVFWRCIGSYTDATIVTARSSYALSTNPLTVLQWYRR